VGVASKAVESLSQLEELDEVAVQGAYGEYLAIMKVRRPSVVCLQGFGLVSGWYQCRGRHDPIPILRSLGGWRSIDRPTTQTISSPRSRHHHHHRHPPLTLQEVHEGLASRAHWIRNYVPYQRSAEALRQEVAVLELRLGLLKEEARRAGYRGEEEGGGGGGGGNDGGGGGRE
jgi:uncharacterized membrane protein YgcG